MPDEVREHLARDQRPFLHPESLQILQIHSSMTVLLLFSSPHSFSTGFRSEDWNGHSRSLVLCTVTHFCVVFEVCVWIIVRLEDPNMAHFKISNRVSHLLIFYLLVFDRIHDAMCLNKMSKTSSRNIGLQHQKYSSIFHCTHGVLFIPVFTSDGNNGVINKQSQRPIPNHQSSFCWIFLLLLTLSIIRSSCPPSHRWASLGFHFAGLNPISPVGLSGWPGEGRYPKHINWSLVFLRDRFLDPSSSPHTLHHWDPSYRHMASPTIATPMTHSSISLFNQMIQR